jgi:hypothetical protein
MPALLPLAVAALALGQVSGGEKPRSRWLVEGFIGKSIVPFLGSEDPRELYGFGIQYAHPSSRKLRFKQYHPEVVHELYYHRSSSPGVDIDPPNRVDAVGLLTFARYRSAYKDGVAFYLDIGGGLHYTDQRTVDLSSRLSSTPLLGLGISIRDPKNELLIGLRYLHISNAGLEGNNQGQNQIMITIGFRF